MESLFLAPWVSRVLRLFAAQPLSAASGCDAPWLVLPPSLRPGRLLLAPRRLTLVLLLIAARAATVSGADAGWRDDLRFLAAELPRRHANAFAQLSPAEWRQRIDALDRAIPALDDLALQAEFMILVAALGDSHTALRPAALFQTGVPLRLVVWPDGLRVFSIAPDHAPLVGARLVAVTGRPLAEVEGILARVLAADNPGARAALLPTLLTRPKLLQALGLARDGDPIRYRFSTVDHGTRELVLSPGELTRAAIYDRPARTAVTDQRGPLWHHFEYLTSEGIAYVQFNRCASDPAHDLTAFIAKVRQATAAVAPKAWVFDLQYNGGGNSALGDRLFAELLPRGARVLGIIGPQTFSSGVLNAMTLRSRYGAVLVGRPTGGRPTHFGEVRTFTLPHSKLVVQYSTKRFVHGDPDADAVVPDHLVARSHADHVAGRDPILEKIRELVGN